MPVLEIEKIYQNEKEIKEYREAINEFNESKDWRFIIDNCIPDFNLLQNILGRVEIRDRELKDRELEAWNRLFGFLDDLTPVEWQQFNEAIKRRPLFD